MIGDIPPFGTIRGFNNGPFRRLTFILFVFDVTNRQSFENLSDWQDWATINTNRECLHILIGNKCDLDGERTVLFEEAYNWASERGYHYIEASAKNGYNMFELF